MKPIRIDEAVITPELVEEITSLQYEDCSVLNECMDSIVDVVSFLIKMSDLIEDRNETILHHCKRLDAIRTRLSAFSVPKQLS